jgi:hypothetical protein
MNTVHQMSEGQHPPVPEATRPRPVRIQPEPARHRLDGALQPPCATTQPTIGLGRVV